MIRLGTPADLGALADIYRRASLSNPGDRDRLLAHPEHLVLEPDGLAEGRTHVAAENGVVVGFATWAETDDGMELEDLFVDPDWMRHGIGRALMMDLIAIARGRGTGLVEVTANHHALAFYGKVGFAVTGEVQTRFGPAPRMRLEVPPGPL